MYLGIAVLAACSSEESAPIGGSPLMSNLISGMPVAEALQTDDLANLTWEHRERERYQLQNGDDVVIGLAEASGFHHLGVEES